MSRFTGIRSEGRRFIPSISAVATITFCLVGLVPTAASGSESDDRFPHEYHEGLFPLGCASCHADESGDPVGGVYSVTPDRCAGCHDDDERDAVEWTGPPPPHPTSLAFDHFPHADAEVECWECHATEEPETEGWMEVVRIQQSACWECHDVDDHLAVETDCIDCHVPIVDAPGVSMERLAAFPAPATHESPDFIHTHGVTANADLDRCATCHSQSRCEQCHLNASTLPAVLALSPDAREAEIVSGRPGSWPKPETHEVKDFATEHGELVQESAATCANCHTQDSCTSCHANPLLTGLDELPNRMTTDLVGVLIDAAAPFHGPEFRLSHGPTAASNMLDCMTCHTRASCEDCHQGPANPGFHPENFFFRHAAEVFARDTDCTGCHTTEVFCRDCHIGVGLSPSTVRNGSYHDREPFWLISHAPAARQGLDACASCHQQTDCLKCHSAKEGWGINPHGPDFDAARLADKSPLMCSRCHLDPPTE